MPRLGPGEQRLHVHNGLTVANILNRMAARAAHNEFGEVFVASTDDPRARKFLRAHWAGSGRHIDGPCLWLEFWGASGIERVAIPPGMTFKLSEQDRIVTLNGIEYRFL